MLATEEAMHYAVAELTFCQDLLQHTVRPTVQQKTIEKKVANESSGTPVTRHTRSVLVIISVHKSPAQTQKTPCKQSTNKVQA